MNEGAGQPKGSTKENRRWPSRRIIVAILTGLILVSPLTHDLQHAWLPFLHLSDTALMEIGWGLVAAGAIGYLIVIDEEDREDERDRRAIEREKQRDREAAKRQSERDRLSRNQRKIEQLVDATERIELASREFSMELGSQRMLLQLAIETEMTSMLQARNEIDERVDLLASRTDGANLPDGINSLLADLVSAKSELLSNNVQEGDNLLDYLKLRDERFGQALKLWRSAVVRLNPEDLVEGDGIGRIS